MLSDIFTILDKNRQDAVDIEILNDYLKVISYETLDLYNNKTIYNILDKEEKGFFNIDDVNFLVSSLNEFLISDCYALDISFEKREREKNFSLIDKIFKPGVTSIEREAFLTDYKTNLGIAFLRSKLNEVGVYLKKKSEIKLVSNAEVNVNVIKENIGHSYVDYNNGIRAQLTNDFIIQGKRKISFDNFSESFNYNSDLESSKLDPHRRKWIFFIINDNLIK